MDEVRLQCLVEEIVRWVRPRRVYLFGSRAREAPPVHADVDLAVEGARPLTWREERQLREALDHLAGLWSVDLVFLDRVSPDFAEHVRRQGKVLYDHEKRRAAGPAAFAPGL